MLRALLPPLAALALASLLTGRAALAAPGPLSPLRAPHTRWYLTLYRENEAVRVRRGASPALSATPTGSIDWSFKPVQVQVDIDPSRAGTVPIVVVPVPVPVPGSSAACDASIYNENFGGRIEYQDVRYQPPPQTTRRPPFWNVPPTPAARPPPPARPAAPARPSPFAPADDDGDDSIRGPARLPPPLPDSRFPPLPTASDEDDSGPPPRFDPVDSSERLVQEFRAQTPKAPELPPMLLSGFDASERARVPDGSNALTLEDERKDFVLAAPPVTSQPRGAAAVYGYRDRGPQRSQESEPNAKSKPPTYNSDSLRLIRGQVTVPRADYTEPYTVWFDERSGAARVDLHGGSATTFRAATPDGRVRRALVWMQRSGPGEVRRCAMATAPRGSSASGHPALPDLTEFSFAGKEESPFGPVEVWQRSVQGRPGEQGAARGEVLTTRHQMRVMRVNGSAVPMRYTVAVDSSTLGPDCDGYEHVYQSDVSPPIPPKFFDVDLDKLCDVVENLDASSEEDSAKLEPLREFTLPHRDLRYDQVYDKYRAQFARQYADEKEEAVRKNVIMQSTRFSSSGNRQGATSELGTGLLGDRLRVEVQRMMGAEGEAAALANGPERESFPYSRDDVRGQERRLPTGFDWRSRGGVSPVGFQGFSCASCWAFAVSGAVEGALFRRTRRLVPLSYQCLVDCAHPFGGKGCSGTWPSHAYNYVQERGLPALDEYPPYKEKVERCTEQRVPSQTKISGHVNVTSNSVPALKVAIRRHAPSVVIVDAECQSFILHKKGVLYDDRCGKALRQLHHAVLAVGWGERRGEPHFILKNSWSAKWGEKGYIRVHARSNTCGVLTMPSYPLLEEGDVRQPLRAGARQQRHHPPPAARANYADDDLEDSAELQYF